MSVLLDAGADPDGNTGWRHSADNSPGSGQPSPLEIICGVGVEATLPIAEVLIDHGASSGGTNDGDTAPIYGALRFGNMELLGLLLDAGVDPDGRSDLCSTPGLLRTKGEQNDDVPNTTPLLELCARTHMPFNYETDRGVSTMAEMLLDCGANPNLADPFGQTPLIICCTEELALRSTRPNLGLIKLLLAANADPDAADTFGNTPLLAACQGGSRDAVEALVDHGADVNQSIDGPGGTTTALQTAAEHGSADILELLLEHGAEPNAAILGEGTICMAARIGSIECIEMLSSAGADVNQRCLRDGNAAIHICCSCPEVLGALLALDGVDADLCNDAGDSALHLVAEAGLLSSVAQLISHGASVSVRNRDGKLPAMLACEGNYLDVVQFLLTKMDDTALQATDNDARTLVHIAAEVGLSELLPHLASRNIGFDNRTVPGAGGTAGHIAAAHGHLDFLKGLADASACLRCTPDCDWREERLLTAQESCRCSMFSLWTPMSVHGIAPLHRACKHGHVGCVRFLLNYRPSSPCLAPNPLDAAVSSRRALFLAVKGGHLECVRLLLDRDINVDTSGISGTTAMHLAADLNLVNVVDLLIQRNACVHSENAEQYTPLHLAAAAGAVDVINVLLRASVHWWKSSLDLNQQTPLLAASRSLDNEWPNAGLAYSGSEDVMFASFSALLADPDVVAGSLNTPDWEGNTPLHFAVQLKNVQAIKVLLSHSDIETNCSNKLGRSPITIALTAARKSADFTIARLLYDAGAHTGPEASKLLSQMCQIDPRTYNAEKEKIMSQLLYLGAAVNGVGLPHGTTPLQMAAQRSNVGLAQFLLLHGANPNRQNHHGTTAIYNASANGALDMVSLLHRYNADSDVVNLDGRSPIFIAAQQGHAHVVKFLGTKDANTRVVTVGGTASIHMAAYNGHLTVVKLLVGLGVDVNTPGPSEWASPLYCAVKGGQIEVVELLLALGATVSPISGKNALVIAFEKQFPEIVGLLAMHGAVRGPVVLQQGFSQKYFRSVAAIALGRCIYERRKVVSAGRLLKDTGRVELVARFADASGLTPLQLALAARLPFTVRHMLRNGLFALGDRPDLCHLRLYADRKLYAAAAPNPHPTTTTLAMQVSGAIWTAQNHQYFIRPIREVVRLMMLLGIRSRWVLPARVQFTSVLNSMLLEAKMKLRIPHIPAEVIRHILSFAVRRGSWPATDAFAVEKVAAWAHVGRLHKLGAVPVPAPQGRQHLGHFNFDDFSEAELIDGYDTEEFELEDDAPHLFV